MNYYDKYDEYLEEMLQAQYKVSEIIKHKLTRGEAREDFIKYEICKQFPQIVCEKGVISDVNGERQTGQLDMVIAKSDARIRKFGLQSMLNIDDCKLVIEVKSNATTTDFKKFNNTAKKISNMDNNGNTPLCGMFCYNINMKCVTILRKFGYQYDYDINAFYYSKLPKDAYDSIDFVLSLDGGYDRDISEAKKFFIIKDKSNKYTLFKDIPVSKYFFRMFL